MTPHQNLSTTQTNVYVTEPDDKSKAVVSSKNITGPPVYYPPNHELFSSKEEASYRAQVTLTCRESGKSFFFSSHIGNNINFFCVHFRAGMLEAKASTCTSQKANQKVAASRELLWCLYGEFMSQHNILL